MNNIHDIIKNIQVHEDKMIQHVREIEKEHAYNKDQMCTLKIEVEKMNAQTYKDSHVCMLERSSFEYERGGMGGTQLTKDGNDIDIPLFMKYDDIIKLARYNDCTHVIEISKEYVNDDLLSCEVNLISTPKTIDKEYIEKILTDKEDTEEEILDIIDDLDDDEDDEYW